MRINKTKSITFEFEEDQNVEYDEWELEADEWGMEQNNSSHDDDMMRF
ncbi:MAG TPA: hypothetical protein VJ771_09105 [Candidatus Nitrosotalea sp.]|nr:hypothetical protein [Candidatus Nitrosotalea sp.]